MQVQFSPWLVATLLPTTIGRAASRSASSRMIAADLPPSSSTQCLICSPHTWPIFFPTSVEPVKVTMSTSGCATRCSEASRLGRDDVDHAGREARLRDQIGHREQRERIRVRRLDHDRAPGHQGRRRLLGDARQREVERAKRRHDADGLLHQQALGLVLHDQPAGVAGQRRHVGLADLGELVLAAHLRVVVPVQRRRHRVVDLGGQLGVTELVDDQVAELRLVLGDQRGEPLHHLGALLDRTGWPVGLVERLARGLDGPVDVGRVRRGDVADLLAR